MQTIDILLSNFSIFSYMDVWDCFRNVQLFVVMLLQVNVGNTKKCSGSSVRFSVSLKFLLVGYSRTCLTVSKLYAQAAFVHNMYTQYLGPSIKMVFLQHDVLMHHLNDSKYWAAAVCLVETAHCTTTQIQWRLLNQVQLHPFGAAPPLAVRLAEQR